MANKDLDDICERLGNARYNIKEAQKIAEKVGDKKGAENLDRHEKELHETHKEFSRKRR